ncbi:polyhydroxyalkanoate synthase [Chromohalobacter marismortui]|uniref:Polyhydroxyalkanoate synthase n=1 Tax=Chromohalobacter marismortui TaxID=42055 RepID=A0A4R7NID1_9GAMM|nr:MULTISPECIES: class I poly(R)-hydroxyalkanoic acid synthase [Chromohalobacter]MCI0511443.1 class I poly(R)-hydroxyalkanoic acid synthase [Chromohalobacter sp.]MCI0592460.1 class I poly(R)-hydroxyalkanoic acid synthase [Chromohalobacter sp.]TDU20384.1 polyhydroxyalkanoate synthase [Chromohalobacter marismortui]
MWQGPEEGEDVFGDPHAWQRQVSAFGEQYQALMQEAFNRLWPSDAGASVYADMQESLRIGAEAMVVNAPAVYTVQMRLAQDQLRVWQNTLRELMGERPPAVIEPSPEDRRFRDDAWHSHPFYHYILQQYLLFVRAVNELLTHLGGLTPETRHQLEFYARQYVNALAPSNFVSTNPEVVRKTLETRGQNLVEGIKRLREDLANSAEGLNVAMSDRSAFRLGENLAITPGEVIFENELMQLIQYHPSTDEVFKTPLLIVPPWINKYYVLDLRPDNSLVKWLVAQGHTVFMISWRNPGPEQRHVTWADYMQSGPIAAMAAIEQACGEKSVNLLSYCIGGTLAATTVAYLTSSRRGRKVRSVTYMATLQDFSDPGEIGVFLSEPVLAGIERQLARDGYLDGRAMAFSFNLLRENDLFWSFYISNYLKGEAPAAFDLLYWNSDGTNLPAGTHGWYLRHMYRENRLAQSGGIELDGVKIDLRKVSTPSYFVSARDDHIAKWRSSYLGARLPKGPSTFVLGGAGHIAGIVNPPAKRKYGYWTHDEIPDDPDAWLEEATFNEGSWWPHWQAWMTDNRYADPDKSVAARHPGDGELVPIEPAPGRYVRQTIPEVLGLHPADDDASTS